MAFGELDASVAQCLAVSLNHIVSSEQQKTGKDQRSQVTFCSEAGVLSFRLVSPIRLLHLGAMSTIYKCFPRLLPAGCEAKLHTSWENAAAMDVGVIPMPTGHVVLPPFSQGPAARGLSVIDFLTVGK